LITFFLHFSGYVLQIIFSKGKFVYNWKIIIWSQANFRLIATFLF
jgi:hypothetical protein